MSLRKVPTGDLREGFTTGTSATAAAKAALTALITGQEQKEVKVHLPVGKVLNIPLHSCQVTAQESRCSVIKDAGDDPDVTNGAEIGCEVRLTDGDQVVLKRGEGVGVVTLPGLEIGVGEPAINPVPRQMIRSAIGKLLHDHDKQCGVEVTVFVTNGKALAKKTLNERVGIREGLSILGTTGIVKPYSAASYIASIVQGVDVACANGIDELVLNSGARSEKYLRQQFPDLPEQAFIHYGNWIGETLQKVEQSAIRKVSIGIMLGKAVKLAEGWTDTHSCVAGWNRSFIQQLAREAGYDQGRTDPVAGLNMASRLTELFEFTATEPLYQAILKHGYQVCRKRLQKAHLELFLVGKNGEIIPYANK